MRVLRGFSFSPTLNSRPLKSLSFDGSNYSYDQNGRLIANGTGKPALPYSPLSFFQTGNTTSNELAIEIPGPDYSRILVNIEHKAHFYKNVNHGFHNNTTPRFDKEAADLSWKRTIAFFKKHLK